MKRKLAFYEKLILETIIDGAKTVSEITKVLPINLNLLLNSLNNLQINNLLSLVESKYVINEIELKRNLSSYKNYDAEETCEILRSSILLKDSKRKNFELKKARLTSKQLKYLVAMFFNIEAYIKDSHKENLRDKSNQSEKILFHWGNITYQELALNLLN